MRTFSNSKWKIFKHFLLFQSICLTQWRTLLIPFFLQSWQNKLNKQNHIPNSCVTALFSQHKRVSLFYLKLTALLEIYKNMQIVIVQVKAKWWQCHTQASMVHKRFVSVTVSLFVMLLYLCFFDACKKNRSIVSDQSSYCCLFFLLQSRGQCKRFFALYSS